MDGWMWVSERRGVGPSKYQQLPLDAEPYLVAAGLFGLRQLRGTVVHLRHLGPQVLALLALVVARLERHTEVRFLVPVFLVHGQGILLQVGNSTQQLVVQRDLRS